MSLENYNKKLRQIKSYASLLKPGPRDGLSDEKVPHENPSSVKLGDRDPLSVDTNPLQQISVDSVDVRNKLKNNKNSPYSRLQH